ncbi:hypothetical protein A5750_01815 [Mycobacterium sp. 852002-51613_SCH5001154]|uniref:hypothetical protein n=1 Tax=Mycobacterium sp. 852002-51613_SCH5001154 TaxID=1834104 RepID=UPI0007FBA749|nr:hypothetical protein [Mycobacterium sp. 852002-51613_SCH5001154]OBF72795.1 hypothetical protein A5750_01815 [Mycobacterium sp. 852002-51613_SCH5001154]
MTTPDFKPAISRQAPDPRVTLLYAGTLVVAVVSGICALVALAAGSPLQFGISAAVFGASWIATDFIERTVARGRERFARRCEITVGRSVPGYRPSRVVYTGDYEHFSRPAPRVVSKLAA